MAEAHAGPGHAGPERCRRDPEDGRRRRLGQPVHGDEQERLPHPRRQPGEGGLDDEALPDGALVVPAGPDPGAPPAGPVPLAGVPGGAAVGSLLAGLLTIPSIAWLPLAILLFKLSESAILFVIVIGAAPSIAGGLVNGIDYIQPILLRAGRVLGLRGMALYKSVILPASLPGIVVGLRLGIGLALFVIVGAEFMGADAGLGHLIMEGRVFFNPAQIVMGALVLGLLGSLLNTLLLAAERRLIGWRAAS